MAHLCLAVMGKKPGTPGLQWVYLRKGVQTFLTYEMGTGFAFPYSNGDHWSGTVHYVMNYAGFSDAAETIYLDILVDWDTFERLTRDPAWSLTDPGSEPEDGTPTTKVRHLRIVPPSPKE